MGFCYFIKAKDEIGEGLTQFIRKARVYGHKIKYLRCNGAGENTKHVEGVTLCKKIKMEYTSTDTPQYNGVAEQQIAVLKLRGLTMMQTAKLNQGAQNLLWGESVR